MVTSAAAEAIEEALRRLWTAARAAWPDVDVPFEAWARHVTERLPAAEEPAAALAALHAADLYLACACARGEERAIAIFEQRFLVPTAAQLGQRGFLPGFADDFKQHLEERLLVAGAGLLPRIGGYSGRGPLQAWVRMAAVRTAINLREAERPARRLEDADVLALSTAAPDPELALLRVQCRDEFREAFQAALDALDARGRNLLRFHFLQGLAGHVLAAMYGVTRRTVHRWIEEARETLLARTREGLAARLVVPAHELESLMHALRSELGSTLARHLQDR